MRALVVTVSVCGVLAAPRPARAADAAANEALFRKAADNGVRSEEVFRRTHRMVEAWLAYADPRTLLLPDYLPGEKRGRGPMDLYTPHNSGADNYPYLVATTYFTDRALYDGRLDRKSTRLNSSHSQISYAVFC